MQCLNKLKKVKEILLSSSSYISKFLYSIFIKFFTLWYTDVREHLLSFTIINRRMLRWSSRFILYVISFSRYTLFLFSIPFWPNFHPTQLFHFFFSTIYKWIFILTIHFHKLPTNRRRETLIWIYLSSICHLPLKFQNIIIFIYIYIYIYIYM